MKTKIDLIFSNLKNECITEKQAHQQVLGLLAKMPAQPIERYDAELWLAENKDIWNHPRITDRTDKESYEVADLMAEFANQFFVIETTSTSQNNSAPIEHQNPATD